MFLDSSSEHSAWNAPEEPQNMQYSQNEPLTAYIYGQSVKINTVVEVFECNSI